jgi:signal transduction histidine kinase
VPLLAEWVHRLPLCLGLYDLAGRCVLASEALARWLERPLAEVVGRTVEELWPGDFGKVMRARQQPALAGAVLEEAEDLIGAQGWHIVRVSRIPWRPPGGEVEGVLEWFQEPACTRMAEVIGRLALGVAHDFNNSLALIRCHLDLLEEMLPEDSRARGRLDEMRLALDHARELPQQLVRFVQGDAGRVRQSVDLNTLLSSVERLLRPRLGHGVSLRLELAPGGAWVEGDPVQLTQVLLNLAGNALDAMPQGGHLLLRCERRPGALDPWGARPRSSEAVGQGGHIRITIRDSGTGMMPQVQQRLFEPFFTTREGGTGLGLSVVQELVRGHGGVVRCQSVPGQGTTFHVLLPVRAGLAAASEPTREAAVLVLERKADIRQLWGKVLEHGRFTPVLCADFHEARQSSHDEARPIRLIVVDAELCAGRGAEELAELLGRHGQARLLFTSAGDGVPRIAAEPRRPARVLLKPFRAEQFLHAVEAALAEEPS